VVASTKDAFFDPDAIGPHGRDQARVSFGDNLFQKIGIHGNLQIGPPVKPCVRNLAACLFISDS
jgi:hypothetical protein